MEERVSHLLMADLVDYSRTMENDRDHAIGMIRDLRDTHLEPVAARFDGTLLKRMGDGWIFEFHSDSAAVETALQVQRGLALHETIRLRIACHSGNLVRDHADFYGPSVNLAQRILTEAPPGGVMVSQQLFQQLPLALSGGFRDAGSFRLKNIAAPVTLYQWRPDEVSGQRLDEVPGIALEPFGFAPDDSDTRAAAEDLREQLMVRLSRRTGIRVLDDSAGQARNATYMLRGRLRIVGKRARLSLAMVLTADSRTVWSQNYEGDPSDIFAFCDDVIEKADVDLRLHINAFDGERVAHLPEDRLSLSELRSHAASAFYRATMEGYEEGQRLMQRAERLAPEDPMTISMLAEATILLARARHQVIAADWAITFEQRLNLAIELAPRSDYAIWTRGLFRLQVLNDPEGAASDLRRVLTLSPSYVPGLEVLGQIEMASGRFMDAEIHLQRAVALSESDTLLPYRLFLLAVACCCLTRYGDAADHLERAIQLRSRVFALRALRAIVKKLNENSAVPPAPEIEGPKLPSILAPQLVLPPEFAWLNEAMKPDEEGSTDV